MSSELESLVADWADQHLTWLVDDNETAHVQRTQVPPVVWCGALFFPLEDPDGYFGVCQACVIQAVQNTSYDSAIARWWRGRRLLEARAETEAGEEDD